ncbi:hypothetical protein [Streptomyces sp. SID10853]|uniref:hypothetical protein n=1 Tax=Streptomyces sp. SID10853 TaxID=2706028 RepID=UPI0031BB2B61
MLRARTLRGVPAVLRLPLLGLALLRILLSLRGGRAVLRKRVPGAARLGGGGQRLRRGRLLLLVRQLLRRLLVRELLRRQMLRELRRLLLML